MTAVDAQAPDDGENRVLGVHACREPPFKADSTDLERRHGHTLGRQHIPHLRCADPEGESAERSVSGRVAVATRDGHARLREPQLGADDVDDALRATLQVEEWNAMNAAVTLEGRGHRFGHDVGEGPRLPVGGHDVIHRRERPVRRTHGPPARGEHVERLRAGDFMHQMQTDVELREAVRQLPHGMLVPDFLKQRRGHAV